VIRAIKQKGIVGREGKIELHSLELEEGTSVDIIILVSDTESDTTEYLLSTEANQRELSKAIERIENKENLTEQYINDSFNENSYFSMLANSEVSKFYHLAYLEKLSQANVIFYRYDAVLDDKTTEICTSLDGNIYRVDTSLIGMRSYYSTSPEISTRVNPYIDKDTLQDAGIPVPGMYHPNCRSTLVGSDGSTITR